MFAIRAAVLILVVLLQVPSGHADERPSMQSVEAFLQKSVEKGSVAGGVLLVYHRGEPILEAPFGFADLEAGKPYKMDTPVIIASISKPLIGTILFRMQEAGKLNLDAPITEYLPEFADPQMKSGEPSPRPPKVGELLTHTSGFRSDYEDGGRIWFQDWTKERPLSEVVAGVAKNIPLNRVPGTKYAYSGIGTDVAARIGEVVSGERRNAFLQSELAEPLQMDHTFYFAKTRVDALPEGMPIRYYRGSRSGKLLRYKKRLPLDDEFYSSSGGTVVSTAEDLGRWLLMLRSRGILPDGSRYLSAASMDAMLHPAPLGYNAAGGLFIRRKNDQGVPVLYAHTGSSGTNVWIDFEQDVIGIMLTQTRASDIKPFRIELQDRVTKAVASEYLEPAVSK
ncbi:Esterase EstB [Roseimaritima multifibrata]|uniref:Esterase EstB n=1 Tax=Roseimaritima multifibrata TaxID=1930274 RepID=A0A517MG36_9BACT|nr:serine hydrolase domain-containing protein [Roseimaritima multifibrata]QDS93842.1 Esterase EstB [Roseimaritima multifibrata]